MRLCRDTKDDKYVAVKVMTADLKPEDIPHLTLHTLDLSKLGAEYISVPSDSFAEVGPNGMHQCIVLCHWPPLGELRCAAKFFQ